MCQDVRVASPGKVRCFPLFLFVPENSLFVSSIAFTVEEIGLLSTRSTYSSSSGMLPFARRSSELLRRASGTRKKKTYWWFRSLCKLLKSEALNIGISPKLGVTKIPYVKHQLTAHTASTRSTYMSSMLSSVALKIKGLDIVIMAGRYTVLVLGK